MEEQNKYEGKYSHADMYACAFMMCKGYTFLDIEELPNRGNKKQCRFIIDCPVEVGEKMYSDYLRDEPVPAMTNRNHITTLRENLFNVIKN